MTAALLTAVASPAFSEPVRDVAYYTAHKNERKTKVAECQNNPGQLAKTPNCINAKYAESGAIMSSKNKGMGQIR